MRTSWPVLLVGVGALLATARGQEVPPADPVIPLPLYHDKPAPGRFQGGGEFVYFPKQPALRTGETPPSVFPNGPAGEELRRLQGEWVMVAGGGFRFDENDLPAWDRFTFLGDRLYIGGQCPRTFRVQLDPARQPKEITLMGPNSLSGQRDGEEGIYQLDGDCLRLSLVEAWSARPTDFLFFQPNGQMIYVLERQGDAARGDPIR
jgi:uncharacterized protein (TIGR03067 family)